MNSMTLTLGTYTTTMPVDVLPGDLSFPFDISLELENTSSANIWSFWRVKYPRPALPAYQETYREGFIGMLEPGEADRMREELILFKKRFNDAFARKHKILFGE